MRISDWSSDVCSSDLFIGSEGTLGVVTRVVVRLEEATSSRNSALVALTGFDEVTQLLKRLQRTLGGQRSEEHTSELQSLMRISYAVFCLKKKINMNTKIQYRQVRNNLSSHILNTYIAQIVNDIINNIHIHI